MAVIGEVYRFKFSTAVVKEITIFLRIHQYDDRGTYKEAWDNWVQENSNLIQKEKERLEKLGYKGDILDKLYKSGRYYFRKKSLRSGEKSKPKKRRPYISMNRYVLNLIDNDIQTLMRPDDGGGGSKATVGYFKPANAYNTFYEKNQEELKIEIKRLQDEHKLNKEDAVSKMKKTYKNQYFSMMKRESA